MTKEVRRLLNYAVDLIYNKVDFSKLEFSLDECYRRCSSEKTQADAINTNEFNEEIRIFEKLSRKFIRNMHIVTSHNTFNFTTLQIAYFFEDKSKETAYIMLRYDTQKREIKKYFEYNKYDFYTATIYNSLDEMMQERKQFNQGYIEKHIDSVTIRMIEQEPKPQLQPTAANPIATAIN